MCKRFVREERGWTEVSRIVLRLGFWARYLFGRGQRQVPKIINRAEHHVLALAVGSVLAKGDRLAEALDPRACHQAWKRRRTLTKPFRTREVHVSSNTASF